MEAASVFTVLMFFVAVPVALVPAATSYRNLLIVGIPSRNGGFLICRWRWLRLPLVFHGEPGQRARCVRSGKYWPIGGGVPRARRGCRVRISHRVLGNVGHPAGLGRCVRHLCSKRSPNAARPKGLSEMLGVLAREPLAWALAALYFLTFGGFVAFSIYLPTLLRDQFGLQAGGRRFPNRGIRCARHPMSAARWMAVGSDWRLASSFLDSAGRRCFWIVARRAIDAAVHGWRARMRRLARHRQRSSISTCASIFSDAASHRHRTGRRDGWDGRIFPAFAPRHVSRPARSGLAGFPYAVRSSLCSVVDEWPGLLAAGRSPCSEASSGSDAHRGQSPGGSLGHVVDRRSDRRHRAGLTQSAELRPCAR